MINPISDPSCLAEALSYARRGWYVFPLHTPRADGTCDCGSDECDSVGKHPRIEGGLSNASIDEARIRQWWQRWPEANVGVRTGGISGFVVLDVDAVKGGEESLAVLQEEYGKIPETAEAITGSGGRHILFAHPGGKVKNSVRKLGEGLDVRGDGGYIVAAPSLHRSGKNYTWEASSHPDEVEVAVLPEWLHKAIVDVGEPEGVGFSIPEQVVVGERNTILFGLGCSLREKGLGRDPIRAALFETNRTQVEPPLSEFEVLTILKHCLKYEPGNLAANASPVEMADDRYKIDASDKDLLTATAQAWHAIKIRNDADPILYRYGSVISRIEADDEGLPLMRPATPERLRHELARAGAFIQAGKKDQPDRVIAPPKEVVADMLATREPPLPILWRITEVPTFAPNGALQTKPGYSAESRTFFSPPPDFHLPEVATQPTLADINRARGFLLDDLLGDFPFVTAADRANAVALFLLPYVRDLISGPTPAHLIEAPQVGNGKTLLADVLLRCATGRSISLVVEAKDDDEWRKRLTASLMGGHAMILIDNVAHPLDSGVLAAALTATTWEDRILGKTEMFRSPIRCIWVITANNPTMSAEIARRSIRIRIDAKVDQPWNRQPEDFRHPELKEWADAHRSELVWAALTLTQSWLMSDRKPGKVRPLGSYESWTKVIGGILEHAGIEGFLSNLQEFYALADSEGAAWRVFVAAWAEKFGTQRVSAADLLPLALNVEGLDLGNKGDRAMKIAFGMKLGKARDRVIGRYRVVQAGTQQRAASWKLVSVEEKVNLMNLSEPLLLLSRARNEEVEGNSYIEGVIKGSQGSRGSLNDEAKLLETVEVSSDQGVGDEVGHWTL